MNPFDPKGNCPLCGEQWTSLFEGEKMICTRDLHYVTLYCQNPAWIRSVITDAEVWWSSDGRCEVRFQGEGFKELSFMLPFDVTVERIRILLTFS